MREPAGLREPRDVRCEPAAGCTPDAIEAAACQGPESCFRMFQLRANARFIESLAGFVSRWHVTDFVGTNIAPKNPMPPGVGSEGMAFVGAGFPEGSPRGVERGITAFGSFIGKKESGFDLVLFQYGRHFFGGLHVARVDSEIDSTSAVGRHGIAGKQDDQSRDEEVFHINPSYLRAA